jgi:hypothetical protein
MGLEKPDRGRISKNAQFSAESRYVFESVRE